MEKKIDLIIAGIFITTIVLSVIRDQGIPFIPENFDDQSARLLFCSPLKSILSMLII